MEISHILFSLSSLLLLSGLGLLGWRLWKRRRWNLLRRKRNLKKMDQERLSQAVKVKREMEALISLPGWKRLMEVAKTQMEGRTHSVLLNPTTNPYEQEYLKGEINGMKSLVTIPDALVSDAVAIIGLLEPEEKEEV